MTKVVPVVCPGCKNPIYSKDKDIVFMCPACGTLHSRNGIVSILEYEAGAFVKGDGEKVYLPFWKMGTDFNIRHMKVEGGGVSKFMGFIKGDSNAGHIDMFLPAFQMDPARYKDMAEKITFGQPKYTPEKLEPAVRREPCVVDVDMTNDMADFLFVTIEAEKPGTMQQLDYDLKISSRKLVYLPYYKKGNDLVPGY